MEASGRLCGAALAALVALAGCAPGVAPRADARVDLPDAGALPDPGCTSPRRSCGAACVDTATDAMHCGACANACPAGARCVGGACERACAPGTADCDGVAGNACETDLATSAAHCGACAVSCGARPNGAPACADGVCAVRCAAGFGDCDAVIENGCESATATDAEHCGGCATVCPWPSRSDFSCAGGACRFACRAGYADCDGRAENGCEVALLSARNCGACAAACGGATPVCALVAGSPRCAAACPGGTTECDGACVDTATSPEHCGACGTLCAGATNAQGYCARGACALECRRGYADCDGLAGTGCEQRLAAGATSCPRCGAGLVACGSGCVDTRSDGANCGACGNACAGERACVAGACACTAGQSDCAGACVDLATSDAHCGACANACPAGQGCQAGRCACPAGATACGGACVNPLTDPANCGACGARCATGQFCAAGRCVSACAPPRTLCAAGTAQVCVDLTSDGANCGSCGAACASGTGCIAGVCRCPAGQSVCAGVCRELATDANNCGACGGRCTGGRACAGGACACPAGATYCDAADLCVDTQTSAAHCGACGRACAAGSSCVAGVCHAPFPERVSVTGAGAQVAGASRVAGDGLSGDGRYVAFVSSATTLVPGDTNGVDDVFVYDRATRSVTRVSVATGGAQADAASGAAAISQDGRYVAFESAATNLVAGDTNGASDVFVYDRVTGTTALASVRTTMDDVRGDAGSFRPTLSADGRYVAFHSRATNLVAGDTNGVSDVFVRDTVGDRTTRVSVNDAAEQGNNDSVNASISSSGRWVAFVTQATNLDGVDTNGVNEIIVHDRQTALTQRVAVSSSEEWANGHPNDPSISADGRYVVFSSLATNLVAGDTNSASDIFVRDRTDGQTRRVSVSTGGAQGNAGSILPSISADGRYVTFTSDATTLAPSSSTDARGVFVYDRTTGATVRVSVGSAGAPGDGPSQSSRVSADGRFVAFESLATNMVPRDTNSAFDVFVTLAH